MKGFTTFGSFCLSFLVAAILGAYAGGSDLLTATFFGGLFALALVLQTLISGLKFFDRGWHEPSAEKASELEAFVYCGAKIHKDGEPGKKEQIWQSASQGRTAARILGIIVLAAIYFYWRRITESPVAARDLLYLLAALAIVFSSAAGHFLIALALIWLPAFSEAIAGKGGLGWAHLAFLFALFSALIFDQVFRIRFADGRASHPEKPEAKRVFGEALTLTLLVFALTGIVNLIVPERRPDPPRKQIESVKAPGRETLKQKAEQLNLKLGDTTQKLARKFARNAADAAPVPSGPPASAPAGAAPALRVPPRIKLSISDDVLRKLANSSSARHQELERELRQARSEGVSPEAARRLSSGLRELEIEITRSAPRPGVAGASPVPMPSLSLTPEDVKALQAAFREGVRKAGPGGLGDHLASGGRGQGPGDTERPEPAGSPVAFPSALSSLLPTAVPSLTPEQVDQKLAELESLAKQIEAAPAPSASEVAPAQSSASGGVADAASRPPEVKVRTEQKPSGPASSQPAEAPAPAPARSSVPEKAPEPPKPLISKATFEALWNTARFILILAAIALVTFIIRKLFEKADPSQAKEDLSKKLTAEEKSRFRKMMEELEQAKLSAEEEVIRKYHFTLEVLAAAGHPREPSLPPLHYSKRVTQSIPFLAAPIQGITHCFCDVLYGKQTPDPRTLDQYRSRVLQIARQFV